jgi:hypothetical protein
MIRHKGILRISSLIFTLVVALLIFRSNVEANAPMAGCQCTDFVYSQRPDIPNTMGRAKDFLYSSRIHRFPYDQVPQVGDVAVFLRGEFGFSAIYGHVALVIDVNESMDRFSIVGWDGLKADCKLELFLDLPVTYNTYFIHQKESVRIQTFSLEHWIALADEQDSPEIDEKDACSAVEYKNSNLEQSCASHSACCDAQDHPREIIFAQMDANSFLAKYKHLNLARH